MSREVLNPDLTGEYMKLATSGARSEDVADYVARLAPGEHKMLCKHLDRLADYVSGCSCQECAEKAKRIRGHLEFVQAHAPKLN